MCRKAFQCFLLQWLVTYISEDDVFQFLSYLFNEKCLKLPTSVVYYVALKDPLLYSFQFTLDPHLMDLIWKGFFHQHPTPHPSHPLWSLKKVLDHMAFCDFSSNTLTERKSEKVLLLVTLALGFRASQLYTLTHHTA